MGARGKYDTVSKVVAAFTKTRGWKQADLARELEMQPKQLGKILDGLTSEGMPLHRSEEPPHVYWDVPRDWFPGGVHFSEAELPYLVHALLALPETKSRKLFLGRLFRGRDASTGADGKHLEASVDAVPMRDEEHEAALRVEEAISKDLALEGRYYSAASGALSERSLSPYRLVLIPRPRLLALCHRDQTLKWFRLENFESLRVSGAKRSHTTEDAIEAFRSASIDGYNDGTELEFSFLVHAPDAHWVKRNLPTGMRRDASHPSSSSIRVLAKGGLAVVARFVVGLGSAAQVESPELRAAVQNLAENALAALSNTERGTSGS